MQMIGKSKNVGSRSKRLDARRSLLSQFVGVYFKCDTLQMSVRSLAFIRYQ